MKLILKFCILIVLVTTTFAQQPQLQLHPSALEQNVTSQLSLGQQLQDIVRSIPTKAINKLVLSYLLNDAEFQGVVRAINSPDMFMIYKRFQREPEVISLKSWYNSQLSPADESLELIDSGENLKILNPRPVWLGPTGGLQGFLSEILMLFSPDLLLAQINQNRMQSTVFDQFVTRVQKLERPYTCAFQTVNGQNVVRQLTEAGVNTNAVDTVVRNFFGWNATSNFDCVPVARSFWVF